MGWMRYVMYAHPVVVQYVTTITTVLSLLGVLALSPLLVSTLDTKRLRDASYKIENTSHSSLGGPGYYSFGPLVPRECPHVSVVTRYGSI